ncbi:MAG: hypothetical protein COA79_18520 [Planctomycetota bacterium]|nr:MAG: hypothetical protein COA79_18520 [Planctomycetota bacterium]
MNDLSSQLFVELSHNLNERQASFSSYNFLNWEKGQQMPMHQHDHLQLIHVLEGELEIDYGFGWQVLQKNQVHVLPPSFDHQIKTRIGHRQFGINFSKVASATGLLKELLQLFEKPGVYPFVFQSRWKKVLKSKAYSSVVMSELKAVRCIEDYCFALLDSILKDNFDPIYQKIESYLEEHLLDHTPVDTIAEALNMSRSTLQRYAKKFYGYGIAHVHEGLRMKKASDYLLATNRRVSDIAELLAYDDIYQFSHSFKRHMGLSPLAYRKKNVLDIL